MRQLGYASLVVWLRFAGLAIAAEGTAVDAGTDAFMVADAGSPILAPGIGETAAPQAAAMEPGSLDFNLLPQEQPTDRRQLLKLESEVRIRRSMLQWHQALGIATTVLMVGTVITGQLDYTDRFGGGTSTGRYDIWHTSFEAGTVVGFTGDALLALFAPVPFPKHRQGVDTVLIHKIAMFTAAAGFGAEIPLGIYTVAQEGHINQGTFALVHLVIGYVTAAAFATGVTALLF